MEKKIWIWLRKAVRICLIAFLTFLMPQTTVLSSADESGFRYYDQLSDVEKAVYDKLKGMTPTSGKISFSWPTEYRFTASGEQEKNEQFEQIRREVQVVMQDVLDALIKDNPMLFWLDVQNSKYNWEYHGSGTEEYTSWIMNEVNYNVVSSYSDEMINAVRNEISGILLDGSSRYEKLKSIHDYLCDNIRYDYSTQAVGAHGPYGALVNGQAVCEGYATVLKAVCDREGIPCILIVGTGTAPDQTEQPHMWNYVQMEDENWYAIDVTWDDQTDSYGIFYDYFLAGADTTASAAFGGRRFGDTHKTSGDFSGAGYKTFSYPQLSAVAYEEQQNAAEYAEPVWNDVQSSEIYEETEGTVFIEKTEQPEAPNMQEVSSEMKEKMQAVSQTDSQQKNLETEPVRNEREQQKNTKTTKNTAQNSQYPSLIWKRNYAPCFPRTIDFLAGFPDCLQKNLLILSGNAIMK